MERAFVFIFYHFSDVSKGVSIFSANKGAIKMKRHLLIKSEFLAKYHISLSTYQKRMTEMKSMPEFCDGFIQPSSSEVWIDEVIYQNYLVWKSKNRFTKL